MVGMHASISPPPLMRLVADLVKLADFGHQQQLLSTNTQAIFHAQQGVAANLHKQFSDIQQNYKNTRAARAGNASTTESTLVKKM